MHVLISGRWLLEKPDCGAFPARRRARRRARRQLCRRLRVLRVRRRFVVVLPMVDLAAAAPAAAEGEQHHGTQCACTVRVGGVGGIATTISTMVHSKGQWAWNPP